MGGTGNCPPTQISPVERIATSAARLRTLVDQVLDIAKIAAGRLDVRMEAIALRAFLVNVVSEIEPLVAEKHLDVKISTADEIPRIRTDPTHLRQILINLLGNAVKYTDRGEIQLRVRLEQTGPPPRSLTATGQYAVARTDGSGDEMGSDRGCGHGDWDCCDRPGADLRRVRTGPSTCSWRWTEAGHRFGTGDLPSAGCTAWRRRYGGERCGHRVHVYRMASDSGVVRKKACEAYDRLLNAAFRR